MSTALYLGSTWGLMFDSLGIWGLIAQLAHAMWIGPAERTRAIDDETAGPSA
jgi:hypothetical protein